MRASTFLTTTILGGALAFACGGATDASGLFGGSGAGSGGVAGEDAGHVGTGSGSGSSSGSSGSGSSGSGSSSSSSGSSSSGGSSSGGSSSGGSGSGGSSSGSSGGSSSGGSSSGGTVDAGVDPGILCGKDLLTGGNKYCVVGKEVCCAQGSAVAGGYRCVSSGGGSTCAPGGGTPIECDNQAECPGQICCGTLDNNATSYSSVQCQDSCDPTQGEYTFCDPNAVPDVCASIPSNGGPPYTCNPSTILTGYYRCSN